jgi:zinc transport system substrate-binding protein
MCRICILSIISVFTLAACDRNSSSSSAPASQKIDVIATVIPLADFARRIGGERVDVQWLVDAGQRPEELESTRDLIGKANRAAMVITSGPWDKWAAVELTPESRSARLVEPERTTAGRSGDTKVYLWLDPAVVREMIESMRLRLTVLDPAHDADYRKNAQACQAEVDAVDADMRAGLAKWRGAKVLAVRPVWGALCARYGLVLVTPAAAPEEKLSSADFRTIKESAKKEGFRMLIVDGGVPAGVRQQIEEKTGLKTVTLDAVGSSAPDGRNTWAKVMRYDLEQLKKILSAQP